MTNLLVWLEGKKTYLVASALLIHALVITGFQMGDWNAATTEALNALGLSALRLGISKK